MTTYSWLWLAWIIMFCVVEFLAITNGVPGDTLSEQVWKLIGTDQDSRSIVSWLWRAGLLVLLGGMWDIFDGQVARVGGLASTAAANLSGPV